MTERIGDITLNGEHYRLVEGAYSFSSNIGTAFAPKIVEGDYALSDFSLYSVVAQSDFQGGLGQLTLDDFSKYLWAYRVDTRGERATLGVKMNTTQEFDPESTLTLGELNVQAALNWGIASEPEDSTLSWFSLDQSKQKVAIPFATTGATAGSGALVPGDLSGILLWLKADVDAYQDIGESNASDADGDVVKLWKDQSGYGKHYSNASGDCTWEDAEVNSLPAIVGSGTANGWLGGDAPKLGGAARTIFFLVKGGSTGDVAIADFGYQAGPYSGEDYYISEDSKVNVEDGRRYFASAISTANYQVLCYRQVGTNANTLEMWVDGVKSAVDSTLNEEINTGAHNTNATLFARNQSTGKTKQSASRIVEILVYDSSLTDLDREGVELYLSSRMSGAITGSSVDIQRVWMYLRARDGLTSGSTINFAVYSESAGDPNVALANGTIAIDTNDVSYYGGWVEASFATIPGVSAETEYFLVLDASGLASGETVEILTAYHGMPTTSSYQYNDGSWTTETYYTALIAAQYLNQYPDTPPVKFVERNGYVYALAGKRVYRMDTPSTMSTAQDAAGTKTLGADGTDMLYVQKPGDANPLLLFALGSGTTMVFWNGTTTWTDLSAGAGASDRDADRLCIHDNLWWRASENSTDGVFVQGTDDYVDWSTAGTGGEKVRIGDRRFKVDAFFSWAGNLYAGKQDGLYKITYGDTYPTAGIIPVANKVLDLSTEINENNFDAYCIWHGDLYFSLANGVARYTPGEAFSSVTPDASLLEEEQNRGKFRAFAPTLTYMYAVYESGIENWSQYMAYDGAWSSLATSERLGDIGRALFVDSGVYSDLPRVWTSSHCIITSFVQPTWSSRRWTFATDSSDSLVKFFDRSARSPLSECSGRLYTSWIDGDLQNITKDWVSLDVVAGNLDDEYYLKVYYREEETDSFTSLGNVKTEPVTELTFPSSTTSRKIQLRFDFWTNESHNTPQLLGYSLRYVSRPDTTEIYQVQIVISDNLELHNKTMEPRSASTLWADLKTARDADEAITFIDPMGDSHSVHVTTLARQMTVRKEVNDTQTEESFTCTLTLAEA